MSKQNKKRITSRETKRRTVILGPPAKVAPTDDIVEDKAEEHPGHIVERRRRGHATRADEDDREAEVLEEIEFELFVQDPLNHRCDESGQETEGEAVVQLTVREQTLWSNHTPLQIQLSIGKPPKKVCDKTYDNRCGTKHGGRRANKAIFLIGRAQVFNVGEHPRLHTELHRAGNDSGDDLTEEHRARCNLHVVAELKVTRELKRLHHGDITPCLEHHHRNRTARKGISDDQLRDDVEPNLLVRDGLNHTDGDRIKHR